MLVAAVICAGSLLLSFPAYCQSNAITLPRHLGQLAEESGLIVQGWVSSVSLEPHPQLKNLMTVVVTLRVEDTLKGASSSTFTFRQAVLDRQDQQRMMGYRVGQHVLLLMMPESVYGLTSPAGFEQGRFSLYLGTDHKLRARNGFANAGLFRGLGAHLETRGLQLSPDLQKVIEKPSPGPVLLEDLKGVLRTIVKGAPVK